MVRRLAAPATTPWRADSQSRQTPDLLQRTVIYNDRNRFLATGAPLLLQEQRQAVAALNSSSTLSVPELSKRVGTPVLESFHHAEPAGRHEPVLRRHMAEAGPRLYGAAREWEALRAGGGRSARRLDVRGYGGKVPPSSLSAPLSLLRLVSRLASRLALRLAVRRAV